MKRWVDQGLAVGKLAPNVSSAEFRDPDYAESLLERLARHELSPNLLEIEITETAFLDAGVYTVIAGLELLRSAGVTVTLDDFGTDYSSLSQLRVLPMDTSKIDRSFVAGIYWHTRDRAIIEAILRLGIAVGMTTVAEGVETVAQAEFLADCGCTFVQCFLYAPAVDAPHARMQLAA